jgi:hypothetical protein
MPTFGTSMLIATVLLTLIASGYVIIVGLMHILSTITYC